MAQTNGNGRQLTAFDLTNLAIGSIIGADIYIVAALGAGSMGPAMLMVWVLGGLLTGIIALNFAQCAAVVPRVGGPYAYVRAAFGVLPGFMVGWALYLAEWVTLAVFPIALVRYLGYFLPNMPAWQVILIKVLFVSFVTVTNLVGVRVGGAVNDLLTLAKLAPLLFLLLAGLVLLAIFPVSTASRLVPFAPLGWSGFGYVFVLVFWAYAGFELATLPADEVRDPGTTLPRAILTGVLVVTVFYVMVNLAVVLSQPWQLTAHSQVPLVDAARSILRIFGLPGSVGAVLMALGAIVSISGVEESVTLGTSRLSYAMAVDGLLPKFFARLHPQYGTPYWGLLFQGTTTLVVSLIGGFNELIAVSVFLLAVVYFATSVASLRLTRESPEGRLRLPGMVFMPYVGGVAAVFLASRVGLTHAALGLGMLGLGVPLYIYVAPPRVLHEQQEVLLSARNRRAEVYRTGRVFLANLVRLLSVGVSLLLTPFR